MSSDSSRPKHREVLADDDVDLATNPTARDLNLKK